MSSRSDETVCPSSTRKAWPPRWLSPLPEGASLEEGDLISEFAENFCVIVKASIGGNVGEPIRIRDWQRELLGHLFAHDASGQRIHRTALIGIARKNGKSALMAAIAVYEFVLGVEGGEVIVVAKDRDQAAIIFDTCLAIMNRNESLKGLFHKNRQVLTNKKTGTTLRTLSRDALSAEGTSPTCAIVDEVHAHPDDKLWNVLQQGKGARRNPILIGITTAGARTDRNGYDSLAYRLYQHGCRIASGEVVDPTFFFAWWEPRLGSEADHTDPDTWYEANPGLDDIVSLESLQDDLSTIPVPEFRTKKCNQWVNSMTSALPTGRWERIKQERSIELGSPVVLGFDGALTQDSTALVACDLDGHLELVALWERALNNDDPDWIIDADEVLDTIRLAANRYDVLELAYDPAYWTHEMQKLTKEGINAVQFPMSAARMVPAWDSFYGAVMSDEVSHNGDPGLTRHFSNLALKVTPAGSWPTKESKNSKRKIDAAVAAILAFDRAKWHRNDAKRPRDWLIL